MNNNGPPTPPPSSATEIEDAARAQAQSNLPETPTAPVTDPEPPTASTSDSDMPEQVNVYHNMLPALCDLAEEGNFQGLVLKAELADLNADNDQHPSRLLLTTPLVLSYLILDDLIPARFALKRLPESLTSTPLAEGLFNLLASTWERKHVRVYSRAQDLLQLLEREEFPDARPASVIPEMVTIFVASFRQRTFTLLTKAYSSLHSTLAQTYLGLSTEELLVLAEQHQWSYDTNTHILCPKVTPPSAPTVSEPSNLTTFQQVATSVTKLEI